MEMAAGKVMDDKVEASTEMAAEAKGRARAASREATRVPMVAAEAEGHSRCNRFRTHTSCTRRQGHHRHTTHRLLKR